MVQPITRSPFKTAVADCETIAFPRSPNTGCICFRVDQGLLFRWDGLQWLDIPVPKGKLWFQPRIRKLCIWTGERWHVHGESDDADR